MVDHNFMAITDKLLSSSPKEEGCLLLTLRHIVNYCRLIYLNHDETELKIYQYLVDQNFTISQSILHLEDCAMKQQKLNQKSSLSLEKFTTEQQDKRTWNMIESIKLFINNTYELKALMLKKVCLTKKNHPNDSEQQLALSIKKSIQLWVDESKIDIDYRSSNLGLSLSEIGSIELFLQSILQQSINEITETSWKLLAQYYLNQIEDESCTKMLDEIEAALESEYDQQTEEKQKAHNLMLDQVEEEKNYFYDHPEEN